MIKSFIFSLLELNVRVLITVKKASLSTIRGYMIFIISIRSSSNVYRLGRCEIRTSQCSIEQLHTVIFKRLILHLFIKRLEELIVHHPVVTISRTMFSLFGTAGSFRAHVITSVYPYFCHSSPIKINEIFI